MIPEPVATVEELTTAWLSSALDLEVSGVQAAPVGTGQMGACFRLLLQGDPRLPGSVLAKIPASDPAARDFLHGSYSTEVTFYRDLLATVAVSAPHSYYAEISEDPERRGTFTLLLEDLAPAVQGDQILGCSPNQAQRAVQNVAGLHAPRWSDPTLLKVDGLSLAGPDDAELLDSLFPQALEATLNMLGDLVPAEDVATLNAVAPHAGRWSTAHSTRFSLVHGDYRLDNLMFHGDGRLWAVDWQTLSLGLPARDVAFLVSSGLSVPERREHERSIVEAYRTRLCELGVVDYSAETCWDDYRLSLPQTLMIAVLGCAYSSVRTARGDQMFAAMIARGCQAVRDLDVVSVLEAL